MLFYVLHHAMRGWQVYIVLSCKGFNIKVGLVVYRFTETCIPNLSSSGLCACVRACVRVFLIFPQSVFSVTLHFLEVCVSLCTSSPSPLRACSSILLLTIELWQTAEGATT